VRRYAGPAALLAAATITVVLVRPYLHGAEAQPAPAREAKPARSAAHPRRSQPRRRVYAVRSGDTLASIAGRFGTSIDRLLELNPGTEPTALHVGETVRIG
jgi:LysM repeat protein